MSCRRNRNTRTSVQWKGISAWIFSTLYRNFKILYLCKLANCKSRISHEFFLYICIKLRERSCESGSQSENLDLASVVVEGKGETNDAAGKKRLSSRSEWLKRRFSTSASRSAIQLGLKISLMSSRKWNISFQSLVLGKFEISENETEIEIFSVQHTFSG